MTTIISLDPLPFHEISFVFELCEELNELHVGSDTSLPVLHDSDTCFQELRRSDPINQVSGDTIQPQSCAQGNDF